jgi:hypothetical protein
MSTFLCIFQLLLLLCPMRLIKFLSAKIKRSKSEWEPLGQQVFRFFSSSSCFPKMWTKVGLQFCYVCPIGQRYLRDFFCHARACFHWLNDLQIVCQRQREMVDKINFWNHKKPISFCSYAKNTVYFDGKLEKPLKKCQTCRGLYFVRRSKQTDRGRPKPSRDTVPLFSYCLLSIPPPLLKQKFKPLVGTRLKQQLIKVQIISMPTSTGSLSRTRNSEDDPALFCRSNWPRCQQTQASWLPPIPLS